MKFSKIILASNNPHKVEEIKSILGKYGIYVLSLKEAGIEIEIEEDGKTFEENALKKARQVYKITKTPCIADDSGLEVFALNGAPGVYSARFSGEHGNYKKNNQKLLELLKDVKEEDRGARFVSVIAFIDDNGEEILARGEVYGSIGFEERGTNGFGYDPLFIIPYLQKTFAELSSEEKNSISHRKKALDKFLDLFEKKYLKGEGV
ncbi:XTP/dITP diphosphohydrolase [Caloramator fervidus]|uniref:dITP/XTP pyrophosphatase n=1 Tax=Caloramator fervidus TaxID=29344 RepID=A0A1H5VAW5_9CLOT|nr:XTP/dITP diphosphatase [Caloramator fervidus]SEF84350.1 XTP/dITP diphosphohydrolase [Caloramator fervidus]